MAIAGHSKDGQQWKDASKAPLSPQIQSFNFLVQISEIMTMGEYLRLPKSENRRLRILING